VDRMFRNRGGGRFTSYLLTSKRHLMKSGPGDLFINLNPTELAKIIIQ
jgi:hypothetical protein